MHAGTYEIPLACKLMHKLENRTNACANINAQVASNYGDALDRLLEAYQIIWGELPLLSSFQDLTSGRPYTKTILSWIYHDILDFHREAMKYFRGKGKILSHSPTRRIEVAATIFNCSQSGNRCSTPHGEASPQR